MKDGEADWHGLQTTKLKSLAKLFKPFNCDWAPLNALGYKYLMLDMDGSNSFNVNINHYTMTIILVW